MITPPDSPKETASEQKSEEFEGKKPEKTGTFKQFDVSPDNKTGSNEASKLTVSSGKPETPPIQKRKPAKPIQVNVLSMSDEQLADYFLIAHPTLQLKADNYTASHGEIVEAMRKFETQLSEARTEREKEKCKQAIIERKLTCAMICHSYAQECCANDPKRKALEQKLAKAHFARAYKLDQDVTRAALQFSCAERFLLDPAFVAALKSQIIQCCHNASQSGLSCASWRLGCLYLGMMKPFSQFTDPPMALDYLEACYEQPYSPNFLLNKDDWMRVYALNDEILQRHADKQWSEDLDDLYVMDAIRLPYVGRSKGKKYTTEIIGYRLSGYINHPEKRLYTEGLLQTERELYAAAQKSFDTVIKTLKKEGNIKADRYTLLAKAYFMHGYCAMMNPECHLSTEEIRLAFTSAVEMGMPRALNYLAEWHLKRNEKLEAYECYLGLLQHLAVDDPIYERCEAQMLRFLPEPDKEDQPILSSTVSAGKTKPEESITPAQQEVQEVERGDDELLASAIAITPKKGQLSEFPLEDQPDQSEAQEEVTASLVEESGHSKKRKKKKKKKSIFARLADASENIEKMAFNEAASTLEVALKDATRYEHKFEVLDKLIWCYLKALDSSEWLSTQVSVETVSTSKKKKVTKEKTLAVRKVMKDTLDKAEDCTRKFVELELGVNLSTLADHNILIRVFEGRMGQTDYSKNMQRLASTLSHFASAAYPVRGGHAKRYESLYRLADSVTKSGAQIKLRRRMERIGSGKVNVVTPEEFEVLRRAQAS